MKEKNTILIIEDSDEDFAAIQWALQRTKRELLVNRFSSCEPALEYLRNHDYPAVIFLDLNLNGTSGHETLRMIKTDEKLCIIPVVVVTTSTDPKDIQFCYCNGASGYINKPVNFEKFSRSLQILMDYWFEAVMLP